MNVKRILFVFLLSFILLLLGGVIRSHGFIKDIPVSQVLFAVTAFVLVKKSILKGKWRYYVLPLVVLFWHTFAFFFDNIFSNFHDWEYITTGTPNILLCAVGATYGALLASGPKLRKVGIALFLLSATCSAWYMASGMEYWVNYCNVGKFTGKVK